MTDEAAIERRREQRRRWNRDNREKMNAISARYRQNHPEKVKAYRAEAYQFNKKKSSIDSAVYYQEHRDQIIAHQREYRRQQSHAKREEERRIADRMEAIERDAVAIFSANPETFGLFKIGKMPERTQIGMTPARTVALRLAARRSEPTIVEDGFGQPCRGGGPQKGKRGRRQAIVTVVSRRGVAR
jgi:hypothetical protein